MTIKIELTDKEAQALDSLLAIAQTTMDAVILANVVNLSDAEKESLDFGLIWVRGFRLKLKQE